MAESTRSLEPPATMISKVLSQYELLQLVCSYISSADIIHLAATCKEHQSYIASSKRTLANLLASACCDGSGIVSQAKVFGHWKGDPSAAPADFRCLTDDTAPCSSCGAQVCDVSLPQVRDHRHQLKYCVRTVASTSRTARTSSMSKKRSSSRWWKTSARNGGQ